MTSTKVFSNDKLKICGVIVTHYPSSTLETNILSLLDQASFVVVVDNGTVGDGKKYLYLIEKISGVHVIYNDTNLGIAAGLNIGVIWARDTGFEWVVTLDQDSRVTHNMFALMLEAYDEFPDKQKVALIAPRYHDETRDEFITFASKKHRSSQYARITTTMTSGNLIKTQMFSLVGFYEERLFIDLVDTEFCLRCGNLGFVILEAQTTWLEHNLGYPSQHRFLWKEVAVGNYSSVRRYYMTRNRMWLYRRYFWRNTSWVFIDAYRAVREFLGIIVFEKDRVSKILAILRGGYHGVVGKLGPM